MKVVACPTELLQILRENTCFVTAPFFCVFDPVHDVVATEPRERNG